MILGEIADKMVPAPIYLGAALLIGISAAATLSCLRGRRRQIVIGSISALAALLAWGLQIDSDLTGAARTELGDYYVSITQYWILASAIIAILLALVLRRAITHGTARNSDGDRLDS